MSEDTVFEGPEESKELISEPRKKGRPKGSLGTKPNAFAKRRRSDQVKEDRRKKELKARRDAGDTSRKPKSSSKKNVVKEETKQHLTIEEQEARAAKLAEQRERIENANKIVESLTSSKVTDIESKNPELYRGLTEQQKTIVKLKMRGIPQSGIAQLLKVSQAFVSVQLKKIREHLKYKGREVDQDLIVGETTSLYEEIEHRGWELYFTDKEVDKTKALALIMSAREKQTKLLMDLGKIEKASVTNKVEVTVSPFLQKWKDVNPQDVAQHAIASQLPQLEAPEPPDIEDAEIIEELDDPEDSLENRRKDTWVD